MRPESVRHRWILRYLRQRSYDATVYVDGGPPKKVRRGYYVDTLVADFVNDYIDYTGASFKFMVLGAPRCDTLAADLKKLCDQGLLIRYAAGVQGMSGMGFPKWIWSYRLTNP